MSSTDRLNDHSAAKSNVAMAQYCVFASTPEERPTDLLRLGRLVEELDAARAALGIPESPTSPGK